MRLKSFILFALGFAMVSYASGSLIFFWIHRLNYGEVVENLNNLKTRIMIKIDDIKFMDSHKNDIAYLIRKNWFSRKNRLVAAEKIKALHGNLALTNIIFEPEYYDSLDSSYTFNRNKIKIEFKAFDEHDIYAFIDRLYQGFPGIVIINEFKESYQDDFFQCQLILDWVSFDEENTEA